MNDIIKLCYYQKGNLGDSLNKYILPMITGKTVRHARTELCECVAIGSLLDTFLSDRNFLPDALWRRMPTVCVAGTGFISEKRNEKRESFFRKLDIRGLRGVYTLNRVKDIMEIDEEQVVLGDPGLLASELINQGLIQKKYRVGIIPHYVDFENQFLANINLKGSTIIDVTQNPIECLKKICRCEVIISSSLHGLIVADSFHIPNKRIQFSDKILGGDYKYNDYYSIYNETGEHAKIDLRVDKIEESDINKLIDNYSINATQVEKVKKSISQYWCRL